LVWWLKTSAAH